MSVEIRVPQLPESVVDATLAGWRKQPGQSVTRDESLADLETDKVMLDVPAPVNGVLREIKAQPGATVRSGDLLAVIEEGATAAPAVTTGAPAPAAATTQPAAAAAAAATASGAAAAKPTAAAEAQARRAGPAARRVIEENKLAAAAVTGAGPGGRVTRNDALQAAAQASAPGALAPAAPSQPAVAQPPAAAAGSAAAVPPAQPAPAGRTEQRVPMNRLRARIAERMVQAQATQALLTTFNEVDLGAVQELRARYKDAFDKQHGVKLGFMSFFVKASVEALKRFPVVNAAVDGNDVVYHDYFDIGVAVSTERGLMVPILRDADALSFAGVEQGIAQYAARARSGAITLDDLTGGTFSITNGGIFGSLLSTPIVNAPQSAILGMHKIQPRPVAVDAQVVVRPMMYLALSYDHRLIDGREAVQFLVRIKECVENPERMLLGI
ncbi:MAG TPA: 2-oxoglutarate dehydrogenase complex dihydrolipoyllysine-residue succinyltransferase [Steroidobacteraceae bacterium]|nr:2-oxoglutarate dehydrogenase complex dihydrolipoyllysine-residue succinyltransferase [Steroidobacteraceae bacterium]